MSASKCYQTNPDVSYGEEEEGAVLFNPDTDDTVIINITGRILWNFLEKPRTIEEMSLYLSDKYEGVPIEQITEDVNQFIQDLKSDFLVEVDKEQKNKSG